MAQLKAKLKDVAYDVKNAMTFLGQAQQNTPAQSGLWKELGDIYDNLDSLLDAIEDGCYDETGTAVK